MPRAIWSGAISFGLVNVPVRLFSATSHKEIAFNQLHRKDGSRIKMKRVCAAEDKEVPYDEIAKGYEVSPGQYVMLEKDELAALNPKADKTIAIEDFVDQAEIDPIYYESAYYLAPDKGAGRAYRLLLEAMKRSGKVAIARMVLRTRQYLCALRPTEDAITLSTMLYADEVIAQDDLEDLPREASHKPKDKELDMAEQLIGSLTGPFDPAKYKDEHREEVEKLIQMKAEGQTLPAAEPEEEPRKVINLMDALQASLKAMGGRGAKGQPKEPAEQGERRHRAMAARESKGGHHPASKKKPAHKRSAK